MYFSHHVPLPQALDVRNSSEAAENWKLWKEKYNNYFIISRLENESPAFQLAMFKCPAWERTCNKCKRKNHFTRMCRKSSIYSINSEEEEISVVKIQAMKKTAVFAKMLVREVPVKFQIDCGASANILPYKYARKENILPCARTLVMWNGTKVKPMGTCIIQVTNLRNQKKYDVKFLIVKDDLTPLLDLKTTEEMRLLTWNSSARKFHFMAIY